MIRIQTHAPQISSHAGALPIELFCAGVQISLTE